MNCKLCGRKLHQYEQKTLAGRAETMGECHNENCSLHMITRAIGDLAAMTSAEIETYVEATRRFKARAAKDDPRAAQDAKYAEFNKRFGSGS